MFRIAWLGATHPDVLQGTRQSGEDAGHRREPERGPQIAERLAGGSYKLSGGTSFRRLVVEPVEDDGKVQSVEDVPQLHCLLLSGGVASAPHDLQEDVAHLLPNRGGAFAEGREAGVRI